MRFDDDPPTDPEFLEVQRAWELLDAGDYAEALACAERSLEIDASFPDAHNVIGFIHQAEGNLDEALASYHRALDAEPGFIDAMLNAADLRLQAIGDIDGALALLDDAIEQALYPEEKIEAQVMRIDALLMVGKKTEAAEEAARLSQGPFEHATQAYLVGKAFLDVGESTAAEAHLRDAVEREPHHGDAQFFLGLALEGQGRIEEATVAFLRARSCDESFPERPWAHEPAAFERRVQAALTRLPAPLARKLEGTLIVPCDLPGYEMVADGVDPRTPLLLDDLPPPGRGGHVGRAFIYRRNVERVAPSAHQVVEEIAFALERELIALWPGLAKHATPLPPMAPLAGRHRPSSEPDPQKH